MVALKRDGQNVKGSLPMREIVTDASVLFIDLRLIAEGAGSFLGSVNSLGVRRCGSTMSRAVTWSCAWLWTRRAPQYLKFHLQNFSQK
ncbi:hypothetical protein M758_UG257000 [Ceratodon purpureus]|nr:hypothetical protein M758_UG257000 [Ceratodon purpureus]